MLKGIAVAALWAPLCPFLAGTKAEPAAAPSPSTRGTRDRASSPDDSLYTESSDAATEPHTHTAERRLLAAPASPFAENAGEGA